MTNNHATLSGSTPRLLSFFTALCMFLSLVEYAIPKPLPFLRLGLANLPILLSLGLFRRRNTLLLAALKVLTQGIVTGTLFSYVCLLSAAGSFASCLSMMLLHELFARRTALISAFGLSLAGSLSSAAAQLCVAQLLFFGESTRYIAPPFLLISAVTGSLLGLFATRFMKHSRWYALIERECTTARAHGNAAGADTAYSNTARGDSACGISRRGKTAALPCSANRFLQLLAAVTGLCVLCFSHALVLCWLVTAVFLLLSCIRRKKLRLLSPALVILSVTFFALLTPAGKILLRLGSFLVTEDALYDGLKRSAVLVGMMYISQFVLSARSPQRSGRGSSIFSETFAWFDALTASPPVLKKGGILRALDALLLKIWTSAPSPAGATATSAYTCTTAPVAPSASASTTSLSTETAFERPTE